MENERNEHQTAITALQTEHTATIDALQRDFAKKSATARTLIEEKDEELRLQRERGDTLQTEIETGSHNERRIFELAKMQANREATYGVHR